MVSRLISDPGMCRKDWEMIFFFAQDIRVGTSAFISRDRMPLSGMQDIKTWVFVIILYFSPCISNSVFILAH